MRQQKDSTLASASDRSLPGVAIVCALVTCLSLPLNCVAAQSESPKSAQEDGLPIRRQPSRDPGDSDLAAKLRKGRNLLDEERWTEAAQTFSEVVDLYPLHKSADAALYWLAFALKKEGKLSEADQTLARLLRRETQSSWQVDAQAMRLEIAPRVGDSSAINQVLERPGDQSNDELKVVALQSLVFSNPERALPLLRDLLKPDSKASPKRKQSAVAFLGMMRGGRGFDTLTSVASTGTETELRRTAIFWLGQSPDQRAFDFLKAAATVPGEKKEILEAVLFAIARSSHPAARGYLVEQARSAASPEVRRAAIVNLGMRGDTATVDELLGIYDGESTPEVRQHILAAVGMSGSPRGRARLLEIARTDSNVELRKTAILWFGQRGDDDTAAQLVQLFEQEQNEDIRDRLLTVMSQSRSQVALRKMMEIAKTGPVQLRRRAVFWLGQSSDPEAKKFIDGLLK